MALQHRPAHVALIVITLPMLLTGILIQLIASDFGRDKFGIPFTWFPNSPGALWQRYAIEVTPPEWVFASMWAIVFILQISLVIYTLTLICRPAGDQKGYLYYHPKFYPFWVYLCYIASLAANIGWVFMFTQENVVGAMAFHLTTSISLYACNGLSYVALQKHGSDLLRLGHDMDLKLVRALLHNGLALYCAWAMDVTAFTVGINLKNGAGLTDNDASTVTLAVIGIQVIAYAIIDYFCCDRHIRYTFSPYIGQLYVCTGILIGMEEKWTRNYIIMLIFQAINVLAFSTKIGLVLWRNRQEPEPVLREGDDLVPPHYLPVFEGTAFMDMKLPEPLVLKREPDQPGFQLTTTNPEYSRPASPSSNQANTNQANTNQAYTNQASTNQAYTNQAYTNQAYIISGPPHVPQTGFGNPASQTGDQNYVYIY